DNCDGAMQVNCGSVTLSGSGSSSNVSCAGFSDSSGNVQANQCSQTVVLVDDTPPGSVACTGAIVTTGGPQSSTCSGSGKGSGTATDNCDGSLAGSCANVDLTGANSSAASNCTFTDSSGNSSTCTGTITLQDDTPPAVTCSYGGTTWQGTYPLPFTVSAEQQFINGLCEA